jgi:alkanesulfonate monooxygenase SsuD/methylene tetrahydromethanopterin reductase-like flavin-dependent oxidoreductase (luciferase family)
VRLGVMFDRGLPPEQLIPFARALDETSVDDLWVVEDLGWTGGISAAATALAVTSRLRVGIGITPAPLRNPMLLAMELANLERLHPGRLAAGIGHGVEGWMRQVGAAVPSPLSLLEETITSVRALLQGQEVTLDGKSVHLDGVSLVHPPAQPPPVLAGVKGPRSLALSGRVANGTIVPEGIGPAQVPGIVEQIGGDEDHELVVFAFLRLGSSEVDQAARDMVEGQSGFLGVAPEELAMADGTPQEAAAWVKSVWAAGAETVAVRPIGSDPLDQVRALLSAL